MAFGRKKKDDSGQYRNSDGEFVGEKGSGGSELCDHSDKRVDSTRWSETKFYVKWACPKCKATFEELIQGDRIIDFPQP